MAKTLGPRTNFRVVIEPRGLADFGFMVTSASLLYGTSPDAQARIERDYQERCELIASQAKRHIDYVGSAHVEWDQDRVCEHCGHCWTEVSDDYNGGCCGKDEDAEEARCAAIAQQPDTQERT